MNFSKDAHCSSCGTAFPQTRLYPRQCDHCGLQVWANPIPVSVVLLPVLVGERTGLLVVRRAIEPRKGLLALVGGFLEEHESWQEGGVREIFEETGAKVDAATLTPFWFTSTQPRPNRVLLFSVATAIDASILPPFVASSETSERGVVFGPRGLDDLFAFPLHAEAARKFFAHHALDGNADFLAL